MRDRVLDERVKHGRRNETRSVHAVDVQGVGDILAQAHVGEVAPAEAADSLDEATEYEGEVVSTCDAVLTWGEFGGTTRTSNLSTNPECACSECNHAARKPRLLAFGRDPLVNALTEPDIRFHVPGVQQNLHVRRKFD